MNNKVLILGSNDRAALVAARSFRDFPIEVDNVYFENPTVSNKSRFICKSYFLGDPRRNLIRFYEQLFKLLQRNKYDLLIPINDFANEIVYNKYDLFNHTVPISGPKPKVHELGYNKYALYQVAKNNNVPVPDSSLICVLDRVNNINLNYPVYVKPIYSKKMDTEGFIHAFRVRKVKSENELIDALYDTIESCPVMIQKEIIGHGVGYYFIANHGNILIEAVHERIHEPYLGGASSYRRSIQLENPLKLYAERIISSLDWTGVGMLEFKYSEGDYYLMELNTRLWGSLELSVSSGVNFPIMMYNMFSHNHFQYHPHYHSGKYARNLQMDISWLVSNLKRRKDKIAILLHWVFGFYRLLIGKESLDVEKIYDPGPTWFELKQILCVIKRGLEKLFFKTGYHVQNIEQYSPLGLKINFDNDSVLFICKGNINRSAFACEYLKQKYGIFCESAGTLYRKNRLPPKIAQSISKQVFGVDISGHRSKSVYTTSLDMFSHIFVFDKDNISFIEKHYPQYLNNLHLLGNRSGEIEIIKDPFGGSPNDYTVAFDTVRSSLDNLLSSKYFKS